jgi:hypothetical protein
MVRRRARTRGRGAWWTAALLVLGAVALVWWLAAKRAEAPAPPPSVPGARALGEPPHEDITTQDKEELERVLREHGAGGAKQE